jgi:DNA-binding NtrC family response regulator
MTTSEQPSQPGEFEAEVGERIWTLAEAMAYFQGVYLRCVLNLTKGHRQRAARLAGVHPNTLTRLCAAAKIPKSFGVVTGNRSQP